MCGRLALACEAEALAKFHALVTPPPLAARYNIAPTEPVLMVRAANASGTGRPTAELVRWGLVPAWVKDPASMSLLINARSETAAVKPSFRDAMKRRRCLIPASAFYEWGPPRDGDRSRQPYLMRAADADLFALAGVWETWSGPNGESFDSLAILTRSATADIATLHHRMPLPVAQPAFDAWLDCARVNPSDAFGLINDVPEGFFMPTPISRRINRAGADGPDLWQPLPVGTDPEDRGKALANATAADRDAKAVAHKASSGSQLDLF